MEDDFAYLYIGVDLESTDCAHNCPKILLSRKKHLLGVTSGLGLK